MTDQELKKLIDSLKEKPKCIETHISYVLLWPDFTYKLKKTIQLPFLDFSTLHARKHFCEEELRLNKRLAEAIYLAVVPVKAYKKKLVLEGDAGEVVDYAIKMKSLEAKQEMDKLLAAKKVTKEDMDRLAYKIAVFHAQADIIQKEQNLATLKATFNEIENQVDFVAEHLGKPKAKIIKEAIRLSDEFLKTNLPCLQERSRQGWVRDVHGDLHSKNIFLYEDPVIFDCIEFNADFRQIDLLNEIAFFCMDLEAREAIDLSQYFYGSYLRHLQAKGVSGVENESLFLYFKLYRANVRAKVMSISAQKDMKASSFEEQLQEVTTYLDLMQRYRDAFKQ